MDNAKIQVRGLIVRYGERVVLDSFDADFGLGTTALLGPSGSGKTTLLAVIAGLERPAAGTVTYSSALLRSEIATAAGWIMQSANLLPHRTALANVELPLIARGEKRRDARTSALRALSKLGLEARSTSVAGKMSGGERQRIAVARALAAEAPLILADEPTASLDDANRRLVVESLLILGRDRVVVIATHDPWVASSCAAVIDLRNT